MVNAWSLLYEELNGTMDETYPIKRKGKMTDKNEDDVVILGGESSDTITFTSDGVGAADTISLDLGEIGNDVITFGVENSSDTLNIGTHLPGGMGSDHIDFSGFAGTAYDDNQYYVDGYDPYPTYVDTMSPVQSDLDEVYKFEFESTRTEKETAEWERIEKPKPNLKNGSTQKYEEDKGIADLKSYVASTYQGHYTNENSDVQTLDLIHSVGDAESFCRSNALKYLSRYDKKGSAKNDILKAMHYCLLLYYFSGNTQEPDYTNTRYETF